MNIVVEEGEIVTITISARIPAAATEEQTEEWLRFHLGDSGELAADNPLNKHHIETWGNFGFEWKRDGLRGIREEFDREDLPSGGSRCRVRYREVRI